MTCGCTSKSSFLTFAFKMAPMIKLSRNSPVKLQNEDDSIYVSCSQTRVELKIINMLVDKRCKVVKSNSQEVG